MLNVEQTKEIIDRHLPSILDGLKDELRQTIAWDVKQAATAQVSKFVVEWVQEHVIPEVAKQLVESKDGLISLGGKLGQETVDAVTAAMTAQLTETLKNSWSRKGVFEALFKG